jgi:hypothetical protein
VNESPSSSKSLSRHPGGLRDDYQRAVSDDTEIDRFVIALIGGHPGHRYAIVEPAVQMHGERFGRARPLPRAESRKTFLRARANRRSYLDSSTVIVTFKPKVGR